MSVLRKLAVTALGVIIVASGAACGESADPSVPFTLQVSPEFVQGVIPGAGSGVLVTIIDESETDAPVQLTVSADGAQVSVAPAEIHAGEVAEVTVIADPATEERPLEIRISGSRGDLDQVVGKSTTVFAWEDDRGDYARRLLGVFASWLADNRPDLGIDAATEFSGSFVAPGLLVVSHYLFMSDDWELGLSWHVMVPPDDWAEIYLRPRAEPAPTLAFRLLSQDAALADGEVTIDDVTPPLEVVR